jgi:hypothetical protein
VVPEGADFTALTRADLPSTFIQAAGAADAMTIEWRRQDEDGVERLYTVGRGGERTGKPDVPIEFFASTRRTLVYPDEVFDAAEAGDILFHYFQTQTAPGSYVLREFDLTWPKP